MSQDNGREKEVKVANWNEPFKTAKKGGKMYEIYKCTGCKKLCQAGFDLNKEPAGCIDGAKDIPFFHQNTYQQEEICKPQ